MSTVTEFKWRTYDDRVLSLNQIDDQHLSNIYWFSKVFNSYTSPHIYREIIQRFGGKPLAYKPLPVSGEIEGLKKLGYIIGTDIIFEGLVIGTLK
tara:strand:- start:624 stop:908 length:285 start_codon:yes stop_codon:yes gene_type:complete